MRSNEELDRMFGRPTRPRHAKPLEWRLARAAKAYADGEKLAVILETYRVNSKDLYDRVDRDGIPRRKKEGKKRKIEPQEMVRLRQEEGLSVWEISRRAGVTTQHVEQLIKDYRPD